MSISDVNVKCFIINEFSQIFETLFYKLFNKAYKITLS